jgi:hypothetical protein
MNIEEKISEFKKTAEIYGGITGEYQYTDSKVVYQAEILEELLERIKELERLARCQIDSRWME